MCEIEVKDKAYYIYGAGIVATSIYTAIKKLHHCTPKAFLVSAMEGNPTKIDDIPVWEISTSEAIDSLSKYLIATPEVHHVSITESLTRLGILCEQMIFVDNQLENKLLDAYYNSVHDFTTASEFLNGKEEYGDVEKKQGIAVFQAKCHVDRPLKNVVAMPDYIQPIQVGATLTDVVIAPVRDNSGSNISVKNRNYCELTATYYAWKNTQVQYKGLCHYRRIFELSDEQMRSLLAEYDVDVILPYPSIHYPDIRGQHIRYVKEDDWSAVLQAMKEVAPEYYGAYIGEISKDCYFYNFNMVIAKREVFDDYCRFLFSVLERTEALTTPKGWERADRFAGYLGENLTTIYFRKNKDKLKIVHTGKVWLT